MYIIVYTCTHTYTHTLKQMSACKTGKIWMKSMNYTNVNILVLTLYSRVCHDWGKLRDGHKGIACIVLFSQLFVDLHLFQNKRWRKS